MGAKHNRLAPGVAMSFLVQLVKKRIAILSLAVLSAMIGAFFRLSPLFAIYFIALEILSGVPSREQIEKIILFTVLAMAFRWVLAVCSNALSHVAAYGVLYDLRLEVAARLTRLPLGFILKYDSGDLKRVLQEDIERLEMFLGHVLPDVASAAGMVLLGGAALFYLDPALTLAAFVPLPLALGLQTVLWKGARPVMESYFFAAGRLNASVDEFIRAIPIIKIFGQNAVSMSRVTSSLEEFQTIGGGFCYTFSPIWAAFNAAINSSLLFMLPVGGWRLSGGHIDAATFIFFMLIGVGLMQSLMDIINFGNQMRAIMIGVSRVKDVMEAPVLETKPQERIPSSYDLSFNKVSFSYTEGSPVLRDISFTCRAGETTALVGPSGAGKSTLAQLAARFWDPDEGVVFIGDTPLSAIPPASLNSLVACVFQDVFLFKDTVRENIRIGKPGARAEEIIEAAEAAQIHEFILSLPDGYSTLLGERGARLSGGQKQRLSIARAILKNAPVIILDEATAYADSLNERNLHAALQRLCAERTVLVIAHRLSSIRHAAKIVVLRDGYLVGQGSHEELAETCDVYAGLWKAWEHSADIESVARRTDTGAGTVAGTAYEGGGI